MATPTQDIFPLLDLEELVICLQSCDFAMATEEHIARPTSQYVITLYKQIIENFMGISPEQVLAEQLSSRQNTEGNDESTSVDMFDGPYRETLQMLTLNKICYKFFENVGINDFNIVDLYKPEAYRTRRLLSAVVNYARFREERMFDCNQFIIQMEEMLDELKSKFDDFNYLKAQLTAIEDDDEKTPGELEDLLQKNKVLETNLKKLTILQEKLSIDYNNYKMKKQELLRELEKNSFTLIELESKKERLMNYNDDDQDLQNSLNNSIDRLTEEKKKQIGYVSKLEGNVSNLKVTVDTLEKAIEHIYDILRLLSTDLQESHRAELNIEGIKGPLTEKRTRLKNLLESNVIYKYDVLKEQLNVAETEYQRINEEHYRETLENKKQIQELEGKYNNIIHNKMQEAEVYIENEITEKKIKILQSELNDIQIQFNNEIDNIELHYSTLVGHINNYMKKLITALNNH